MTDEPPATPPPPPPEKEVWLPPPVGGDTRHDTHTDAPDPKLMSDAVDQITNGIRGLWHLVALGTKDQVWEHSQADMWGYSVLVGYVIKKAKNWEVVLLGMAVLHIMAVEGMKAYTFMEHRKMSKVGGAPASSAVPPGALTNPA